MKKEIEEFSKSFQDWKTKRLSRNEGAPDELKCRAVELVQKYSTKHIAEKCNIGFSTLCLWKAQFSRGEIKPDSLPEMKTKKAFQESISYTRVDHIPCNKQMDNLNASQRPLCSLQIGQFHLHFSDADFLCQFIAKLHKMESAL
jgi:hypothetical protein